MARTGRPILIRDAEMRTGSCAGPLTDVLIEDGAVAAIGPDIAHRPGSRVIVAGGGLLLPGLHDHHIHLAGLAVRRQSVMCGPPEVTDRDMLASRLATPGTGWIRGIGYHESVLDGLPDARALDTLVPDRPLRLQHRSGRMWLLNTAALDSLLEHAAPPPGLEREAGRFTGRLFDEDAWLRAALGSEPPDFTEISARLARYGVTGLTDMTPQNDPQIAAHFARQGASGALVQQVMLAGTLQLADARSDGWMPGPFKLHLHEADLPPFDQSVSLVRSAHEQDRPVAIHCVSEVELVFALAVLDEAGTLRGDRIEHASVASPDHVAHIAEIGLSVCVQPHFVFERGDRYLIDVEPRLHADLYRLQTLRAAGIALAGGSDAPFGSADPWSAMRAAVRRETEGGRHIGPDEALTAEQALDLWLADPADFTRRREIRTGARADLCLLARPWVQVSERLDAADVVLTIASGEVVHDCVDQPPV